MASEVFYNRVPYTTQPRMPPLSHQSHNDHTFLATSATTHIQRSVGTTRSGETLTFPPLYLDPIDPQLPHDSLNPSNPAQQPGSFVLGSTFYHHPELNALVSNHLTDASANALDGASGTGHAFLASIFANRDGAHDEDSDADDSGGGAGANGGSGGGADIAVAVPRPKITSEFVSLNEDLVPASLDMHGDMLPADQHPSYPFGNLFGPMGGVITADSALAGGTHGASHNVATTALGGAAAATLGLDFGGGLDGVINLGQSSHGRRSAVSNAWNNFINKASRSKLVGSSAGAFTEYNVDTNQNTITTIAASAFNGNGAAPSQTEILLSAKKLDLSPGLLFRTNTSTVLAPPTWPFRRHGPGNTSYAALLRPNSNVFGTAPASQAVAATLGGLPASANIIKEVWSDLALEELVPTRIGQTSAMRHLDNHALNQHEAQANNDGGGGGEKEGSKKRKRMFEPESDGSFARRVATMEADPLDFLGPISREIRGQAARPWGTVTSSSSSSSSCSSRNNQLNGHRHRSRRLTTYSNESDDQAAEVEHDDLEAGYLHRDLLRYAFSLPPARFSWMEEENDEHHHNDEGTGGTLHVEPDGIGWSTAKRIFVNEERDRLLPQVASRAMSADGGVEAYSVRGIRANQGVLPTPFWSWNQRFVDRDLMNGGDGVDGSFVTDLSASNSNPTLTHLQHEQVQQRQSIVDDISGEQEEEEESAQRHDDDDQINWQYDEDRQDMQQQAQLQGLLLSQYQIRNKYAMDVNEGGAEFDGNTQFDDDVVNQDEEEEQNAIGLDYEYDRISETQLAKDKHKHKHDNDDDDDQVGSFGEAQDTTYG
ncbi:uncharacterized protein MEPE_04799 [Melanopsichium pennsylvanicum]|uniref:Uncharacterized protein n=2 Tax=Melanopsichium pennsylvanicum TaxID=63383 RepID=A0AAJ4XNX2_9BASI|nr:putative protein [Melanopsichium pennsylvanicum 4]SNX86090.1 uncharacterized protein MEPE_04799 [Melanopsichium pennsylvanicum]